MMVIARLRKIVQLRQFFVHLRELEMQFEDVRQLDSGYPGIASESEFKTSALEKPI